MTVNDSEEFDRVAKLAPMVEDCIHCGKPLDETDETCWILFGGPRPMAGPYHNHCARDVLSRGRTRHVLAGIGK